MTLYTYLALYLISIPIFVIIDLLWLGVFAKDFYQVRLEALLGEVNWTPAIVFYFIFLAGLTYFVIAPGVLAGSAGKVAVLGAFFGLVTYATYDLVNLATLKGWPLSVTIVDMIWGACIGALVSTLTFFVYTTFFG